MTEVLFLLNSLKNLITNDFIKDVFQEQTEDVNNFSKFWRRLNLVGQRL